jgi:hypothetical protein
MVEEGQMMKLSKHIPRHVKSMKFTWVKRDFLVYGESFREARNGMKDIRSCFWCKKEFDDGEMMALAGREHGVNVLLCHKCVDKMEA